MLNEPHDRRGLFGAILQLDAEGATGKLRLAFAPRTRALGRFYRDLQVWPVAPNTEHLTLDFHRRLHIRR